MIRINSIIKKNKIKSNKEIIKQPDNRNNSKNNKDNSNNIQ